MRAGEIMTVAVITVDPDTTVRDIAALRSKAKRKCRRCKA